MADPYMNFAQTNSPDDFAAYQQSIKQQQMAEALRNNAFQSINSPSNEMAGRFVVAKNPIANLADILSVGLSSYNSGKESKKQADINKKMADVLKGKFYGEKPHLNIDPNAHFTPEQQQQMQSEFDQTARPAQGQMTMKGMTNDQAYDAYSMDPDGYMKSYMGQFGGGTGQYGNTPIYFSENGETVLARFTPDGGVVNAQTGKPLSQDAHPVGNPYQQSQIDPSLQYQLSNSKQTGQNVSDLQYKPQIAGAETNAKNMATQQTDNIKIQKDLETIGMPLMAKLKAYSDQMPSTTMGMSVNEALGKVGTGDKESQNALAGFNTTASELVAYAKRMEGPQSDKDVMNYFAQIAGNPYLSIGQRSEAIKQATAYMAQLHQRATQSSGAQQNQVPPPQPAELQGDDLVNHYLGQ